MQIVLYSVSRCQDQILIRFFILAMLVSMSICVAMSTGIVKPRTLMFFYFSKPIAFLSLYKHLDALCFLAEQFLIC